MTMIHLTSKLKGIALAVSVFMVCACWVSTSFAQYPQVSTQSNCFTTSVSAVTDGSKCDPSSLDICGSSPSDEETCYICADVTICLDKCSGISPTKIRIESVSSTDCHSVCSPTGDFNSNYPNDPGYTCSWNNPRDLIYATAGGIPDNGCASFRICRNTKGTNSGTHQHYRITILAPANAHCGMTQCGYAEVVF